MPRAVNQELLGLGSGRLTRWRDNTHNTFPILPHSDTAGHFIASQAEQIPARASGRVLVTGGGGNIGELIVSFPSFARSLRLECTGKHLIRRLLSSNIPTTVVDLVFFDDEVKAIYDEFPRAKSLLDVVIGDIRDKDILQRALTPDVTGVIHLAAVSRVLWCLENGPDCEDVNVGGTKAVLEASELSEARPWFIQASSREIYGSAETFPVIEDSPFTPANVYGASKARAEEVIERYLAERNEKKNRSLTPVHAIALRMSNVYGGRADHRERLIPSIMTNALAHRTIQIVGGAQDVSAQELCVIESLWPTA